MKDKGVITDAQFNTLVQTINGLPTTGAELSKIYTAASIMSLDGSGLLGGEPLGVESITSSSNSDIKSLTVPDGATRAIVSIHKHNIIFRTDGGNPAEDVGHTGSIGSNITVGSLSNFKFVSGHSSTDAVIFVSYF